MFVADVSVTPPEFLLREQKSAAKRYSNDEEYRFH